ncbi:MAG: sulfatase-like hydrolase/transferase [Planctomycetaceae bacterium]|nr:sulfatase-like hydrolase/transferase [Planctomycetaceae bacterium]
MKSIVPVLWLLLAAPLLAEERPNFVIIMADDLGYSDVSCYRAADAETANNYQTPRIDQLAAEGLRLTDYHSNGPVCSPTRAALVTGRYQQRSGIDGVINADPKVNRDTGLAAEETTFADVLSAAGYRTAIFGKWHLGYEVKFNPVHQGFELFRGYVSGNVDYFSHRDRMGISDWWHNTDLKPEAGYTTHLITRHALEFIRSQRDQPFCLYVAHESVHSPFQGPGDSAIRLGEGEADRTGDKIKRDIPTVYAEMVQAMDTGVGEIVDLLRELQLERKTLVVFISDNGAMNKGNNHPLRGFKGSVWEGGHRVPGIAWQPGKIKPGVSDETVLSMDWFPTMVDLAGAEFHSDKPLDGVSLAGLLYEQRPLAERTLYWRFGQQWAVRRGDWKLISTGPRGKPELYHLGEDISETRDRAADQSALAEELEQQYGAWSAELLLVEPGIEAPIEN